MLKQIGERVTDDEVDEMILMGDLDGTAEDRLCSLASHPAEQATAS